MIHAGDKVVCVRDNGLLDNNLSYTGLVIGKIYKIEMIKKNIDSEFNSEYKLSDGVFGWIDSRYFIKLEDWRENRLNEIL